jgi:hypothetical protein
MRKISAGPFSGAMGSLDAVSRSRILVFGFKLLVILPFSIAYTQKGFALFGTMSVFCWWYAFFSAFAALFQRQRIGGPNLSAWDEMMAFFRLALLMRFLAAVAG